MAGVVVWCYKNNTNLWSAYEPNVSCELERLFLSGTQQIVQLGTLSSNLSGYQVNFLQMTQVTINSGSVREVQRIVCGPASALGKGVVWEFEGDLPSQWATYDLNTMDIIEEGFTQRNSAPGSSLLDLQQSRVHLPYIIDFVKMIQMRVETGRVRRIQRRPLNVVFSPATHHTVGASSSVLPAASMFPGQVGYQPIPHVSKMSATKSKHRQQPYNASKSVVNGGLHGPAAQANLSAPVLQHQQLHQQPPPQNPGPITRRKLQQSTGNSSTSAVALPQHPLIQQQQQQPQLYHTSSPHNFFYQTLHSLSIGGPYHHHIPGQLTGFQYPPSLPLSMTSLIPTPNPLPHHQMSRPSSTSSLSSSSSSTSSMSVSSSQGSEPLPTIFKVSISKSKKTKGKTGIEVLRRYICVINDSLDTTDCSICFDKLSEASTYGEGQADAHEAVQLNKCRHQFHKLCLLEMYNSIHKDDSLQCPSCKTIYGEKTGICPPGYMQWRLVHDMPLPGYEGHGTIIVSYHISPGTQGPEHPYPGQSFSARGFPRQGFLPDCDKGRKVLKLLMEAFRRRLMFTIATSTTTGETNTVTWNEIHHKTEPHGNRSGHGYPDPHYLDNVLMELAAHGVTEDCLR